MNAQELTTLESDLALTLPGAYKELMLAHPGCFKQFELCDDASQLVYENRSLRDDGFFGIDWPSHYFAIGFDGCGNYYFITTQPFDGNVYFVDHEGGPGPDDLKGARRHDSLGQYVAALQEQQKLIQEDIREANSRIANRRWWQFWIPMKELPLETDE